MITTKEILISYGYPEEESEDMAKEIDKVVNQSYMINAIGFIDFRNIVVKAMFG
jgi:hypothetical protein